VAESGLKGASSDIFVPSTEKSAKSARHKLRPTQSCSHPGCHESFEFGQVRGIRHENGRLL
jgi:hypothetical protein